MESDILSDVIYNYHGLPDLIPDVIPEQKKPLEEPFSKNDEDDLDEDDYEDYTNKELIYRYQKKSKII